MGIHPSTGHSPRHPFVTLGKPSLAWRKEYVLCRGHHNFNKIEPFFPLHTKKKLRVV